jgi:integrase
MSAADMRSEESIYIDASIKRETLTKKQTKTRRSRIAFVSLHGREYLRTWFSVPEHEKNKLRKSDLAKIFREACKRAFPDRPEKHLKFLDLRHSYAIHFIRNGASISLVAQSLGNSVSVCQEYYAGFSLTPETVIAMKNLVGKEDN